MRGAVRKALTVACALLTAERARAWWEIPHMMTAEVARRFLTDVAAAESAALLNTLAAGYVNSSSFVTSAVWADLIKSGGARATDQWHYIDMPFADGVPEGSCPGADAVNLGTALNQMYDTLKDTGKSAWDRGIALRFVIHFLGDAHQPLHCISRCTPSRTKGDAGGNLFSIVDPPRKNLHAYWDSGCGQYDELERQIKSGGDQTPSPRGEAMVRAEVDRLLQSTPPAALPQLGPRGVWQDVQPPPQLFPSIFNESYMLGRTHVYGLVENTTIPTSYATDSQRIARERIVLGGVRLAAVINTAITRTTFPWAPQPAPPAASNGMPTLVAFALGALTVPVVVGLLYFALRVVRPAAAQATQERYAPFVHDAHPPAGHSADPAAAAGAASHPHSRDVVHPHHSPAEDVAAALATPASPPAPQRKEVGLGSV